MNKKTPFVEKIKPLLQTSARVLGGLLLSMGLGILLWNFNASFTQAAITLPDTMRPTSLPDWQFVTESEDPNHPEMAATQTVILFVGDMVSQVLVFLASGTIIMIIFSGARYIFAWGKEDGMERGKLGIFWSVMGLLIVLLSYALVQGIIQIILQVDSTTD